MKNFQITHLVKQSPWPVLGSMCLMSMVMSVLILSKTSKTEIMMISTILSTILFFMWTKDIFNESSMEGEHSKKTSSSIKIGMMLFITSEVLLFISMFWAFFHFSMSPSIEIGMNWPPKNIYPFNYEEIPMLNTIILVSSSATLTLSHHFLINKNMKMSILFMMTTLSLGWMFSYIQLNEYLMSEFSMNDSSFGSTFFLMTGLHGGHIVVGSIYLETVMFQMINMKSMPNQFISFELSVWYWHFVDVVWLFLLTSIYWWGS